MIGLDEELPSSKGILSGTSYREVYTQALMIFQKVKAKTKRSPYLRAQYFEKEKIFINLFLGHIHNKNMRDRVRRLKFTLCAFDLIQNSTFSPEIKKNPNKPNEILYKFYGTSKDGRAFAIQIKESKGRKYLLSYFPI